MTLPGIFVCHFCGKNGEVEHPDTYREVTSWVTGPKLDGPKLREQTGRMAHKHCIDNLVAGQAADQPSLLDEDPHTGEPRGPIERCDAQTARGLCDNPLNQHGVCFRVSDHLE